MRDLVLWVWHWYVSLEFLLRVAFGFAALYISWRIVELLGIRELFRFVWRVIIAVPWPVKIFAVVTGILLYLTYHA